MKIIALMLIAMIITLTSFPSSSGKKKMSAASAPPRGGLGSAEEVKEGEKTAADTGDATGNSIPGEEMPKECKGEVGVCVLEHIIVKPGPPKFGGPCCQKFRNARFCVCKYLMSSNFKEKNAANAILQGCRLSQPRCVKMPIPQTCRPEVINCVQRLQTA
ncbi:unnamed protein product [Microthlaspi erraticum]|uniref:Bifunctional inhibitor/plant lipid transfer protein/seed storage helical domain-containing protein n=1 Tax=Microthlaspi erraticum TaxID=1685480 RepID=A0A6D2KT16_9BRAS|nr:unnamed protein product [Microthlaspi erraticum]